MEIALPGTARLPPPPVFLRRCLLIFFFRTPNYIELSNCFLAHVPLEPWKESHGHDPWTRDDKRACVNSKHNSGNAGTMPSALAVSAIENATTTPGAPAMSRFENVKTTPGAVNVSEIEIVKARPGARSMDRTGNSTTPGAELGFCVALFCVRRG